MLKIFAFLFISIFLFSCGGGNNYQKNLKELDEVYGMCENPLRPLSTRKYKECIAAERANNESFFDLNGDLGDLLNRGGENYIVQYTVNPNLWQAALNVTESYPLKIADNQGGYIETDWINQKETPDNRCLIKVRITSQELVSNGVASKFICEEKIDNQWVAIDDSYLDEEKRLNLKILSTAAALAENSL